MKEFNLSEKLFISPNFTPRSNLTKEDVKEFIRLLKEELKKGSMATPTAYDLIDKLAGDDLK